MHQSLLLTQNIILPVLHFTVEIVFYLSFLQVMMVVAVNIARLKETSFIDVVLSTENICKLESVFLTSPFEVTSLPSFVQDT